MNDHLTAVYLRNTFPKNRLVAGKPKLLAWDSFRCHNSEATKKVLCELGLDVAMVPGGTTKYYQILPNTIENVSRNEERLL